MVRVDPVVDDRDLDPLAGVLEERAPDGRRADLAGAVVEQRTVAGARPDADRPRDPPEVVEPVRRHRDGESGEHDPVAPVDLGTRDPLEQRPRERGLCTVDPVESRACPDIAWREPRTGERRRGELDHDPHGDAAPGCGMPVRRRHGEQQEDGEGAANDDGDATDGPIMPRLVTGRMGQAVHADVAELVDAHGSGPCGGNPVEVRFLSSALARLRKTRYHLL
jgi:hypothetical protein